MSDVKLTDGRTGVQSGFCACGCGETTPIAKFTNKKWGIVKGQPCKWIRGHAQRMRSMPTAEIKICFSCKIAKPHTLEFFPPDKRRKNGTGAGAECRKCLAARTKQWRKDNLPKYRAYDAALHKLARRIKPEEFKQRSKRYRTRLRLEMIAAYGGKCNCCGITEPEFLTLEHVNRDGAEHRRLLKRSGDSVWKDLKSRGWPKDGFTILCWNCNLATARGDICPHKRIEPSP